MRRLRALDLFCSAGGVTRGLQRAGFHVTGVDIRPQPRYCGDEFIQADAFKFPLEEFDFIWASPPCQAFTALRSMWRTSVHHPNLIPATRRRLRKSGALYVIENVPGAPLNEPTLLCGTMFGLTTEDGIAELRRHRLFEANFSLRAPHPCRHSRQTVGVYGKQRRVITVVGSAGGQSRRCPDSCCNFRLRQRSEAMGIDWMTNAELTQAIPPAYSEFIGRQAVRSLRVWAQI